MKAHFLRFALLFLAVFAVLVSSVAPLTAGSQEDERRWRYRAQKKKMVTITGSHIPVREGEVTPLATKSTGPVRIYSRREMDRFGANTTGDFLSRIPGISISGR